MLVLHPFAVAGTVVSGQQEWGAFPVLRRDVSAESLHVRTGGEKTLRIFIPLVSNSEDEEMA